MIMFHYTFIISALGYVLTGNFVSLIVITSLLVVHEFGHYIIAKLLGFNVRGIIIYPFGGLTKIEDLINKDINEELLIATSGVIFQYIYYLLIVFLSSRGIIRDYVLDIYTVNNRGIILFNLLPIYPLDGFKILNLLLSKYFSYNLSNYLTIIISIISIIVYICFNTINTNYSYGMVISIIFIYNYRFFINIKYIYNAFLLERVLYRFNYRKVKVIKNYKKMYKNRRHIFRINNKYLKEDKYLKKYYFK